MRTLLSEVFCLGTYSKCEPSGLRLRLTPGVVRRIGYRGYKGELAAFLDDARARPDPVVVKTHNGPEDDCAAIYVVRNGLAATVSYRHYLRAFGGQEATWEEVVGPCPPFGNWSSHLDAWKPLDRPRTLVIRYEDILAEPARVIERLSAFLGLKAAAAWANPFTELQRQEPDFFRKGQSGEPEELTPAERHAFLAMHRPWMERLGYDC